MAEMSVLRSLPSSCRALSVGLHHSSFHVANQGPQQETGWVGGVKDALKTKIKDVREAEKRFFSSRSGWHFFKHYKKLRMALKAALGGKRCFFFHFEWLWQEFGPA